MTTNHTARPVELSAAILAAGCSSAAGRAFYSSGEAMERDQQIAELKETIAEARELGNTGEVRELEQLLEQLGEAKE